VQINIAERREVEHPAGNDSAVGYDYNYVGADSFELSAKFSVGLDLLGLEDGDSMGEGSTLYRRGMHIHAASGCSVGLRHDERNIMAPYDRFERRYCELRRSTKYQFQAFTSGLVQLCRATS